MVTRCSQLAKHFSKALRGTGKQQHTLHSVGNWWERNRVCCVVLYCDANIDANTTD